MAERWDKIFFTGGANVGRIIAKAAAPYLTPVVLELGGINPAIVSKTADPRLVARRMLWGKTVNAGQLCTSQNYLLVDKSLVPRVVEEFKKASKAFYPQGAKKSPDYSRIINKGHFQRLRSMLDNSKGKILLGGAVDEEELFIEPTVVQVDSVEDSLCTEESFGPFIPILPVENLDEAISLANGVQSTPLGLYPFGSKADVAKSIFYLLLLDLSNIVTSNEYTLQLSLPLGPAVSLVMTPPYTSLPYHSVVSAKAATVLTAVAPVSTSGFTDGLSQAAPAGSSLCLPSATRHTRVS